MLRFTPLFRSTFPTGPKQAVLNPNSEPQKGKMPQVIRPAALRDAICGGAYDERPRRGTRDRGMCQGVTGLERPVRRCRINGTLADPGSRGYEAQRTRSNSVRQAMLDQIRYDERDRRPPVQEVTALPLALLPGVDEVSPAILGPAPLFIGSDRQVRSWPQPPRPACATPSSIDT
jgi:hypothetical protein